MKNYKKVNYRNNKRLVLSHTINEYWSGIKDEKEFENYIKETTKKLNKKDMVNKIIDFIKVNNISEEDMKIFNKILGDHKILNKLQICIDGSYTNGRIFYKNFFNSSNNISISGEFWYKYYCKNHNSLNSLEKLNYMKNHFEVIYLHLVNDKQALEDKMWDDMMDNICDDYPEEEYYYDEVI